MERSLIGAILFASLVVVGTWAIDGVKGVKGGHRPRYPTSANQYGGHNNSALCYKTVPYEHALAQNATGGVPYNTIPVPQDNQGYGQNHGFITILDCCEGYKRNLTSGKCEFHCEQGCYGGECTGPNQCTCQPGWFPENGVCMPVCTQPCQKDAYCFSPNVCTCKLGYDEVNGECRPICPGGCRNGDCIAPHVCRCKPGYVLNDQQECVPVCEGGCPHGECTAPGICTCYNGYVNPPNERESCVPHCEGGCNGGECISPGICNCVQGYIRADNGRCVPDPAQQCRYGCGQHGVCVGHNRCQCDAGFKSEPDTGRCVPDQRSDQPPYVRPDQSPYGRTDQPPYVRPDQSPYGRTEQPLYGRPDQPSYGRTEQPLYGRPDQPSYGRTDQPSYGRTDQPPYGRPDEAPYGRPDQRPADNLYGAVCDLPCMNGDCTGRNQCTCKHGYTFDLQDPTRTRCMPVCHGGCPNGVCTAPNFCICNPGYTKDRSVKGRQRCVPQY